MRRLMAETHETGDWPRWMVLGRQVVIFLLGVGILLFATTSPGHDVTFIITGLILIGLIPIENVISRLMSRERSTT
jgi:hypothetical protein